MYQKLAAFSAALVVLSCGGGDKGGSTNPPPATVSSVTLSQTQVTVAIGDVVTLTATSKDAAGNVLTGKPVTWSSSNTQIATVSSGDITGVGLGTATITASVEGTVATATVTVTTRPVATVEITPTPLWVMVGANKTLTVTLKDGLGNILIGPQVTFTSLDQSKATVTPSGGVVTGVAIGQVQIRATAEGKSGTATINVTNLPEPTITGIAPSQITRGGTATITGTNFGATAPENTVTVAGIPATVTAASATQLTVSISSAMPCLPTQAAPVVVLTGGGPATRNHPLQVASPLTMAVGQALTMLDATSFRCNELTTGGSRYLLAVVNPSTVPSGQTPFSINFAVPDGAVSAAIASATPVQQFSRSASAVPIGPVADPRFQMRQRLAAMEREHMARMESDRAIVRRLRSQMGAGANFSRLAAPLTANTTTIPLTVGQTAILRVRSNQLSCSAYDSVTARVKYVGPHGVVLEDVSSPLAGQMDTVYQRLGQQFDDVLYPIEANFGDITAYDANLDNPGKVVMLFTPKVNQQSDNVIGYVSPCDFFAPDTPGAASSNKTKIFYARVPLRMSRTPNSVDFDEKPTWALLMPSTLVHESKHLTAVSERSSLGDLGGFDESWLEEGTAQLAAELYGRTVWTPASWKGNITYAASISCEVLVILTTNPPIECAKFDFNALDFYLNLEDYYQNVENRSFLSPGNVDGSIYGSAWLFVRWMVDQYGGTTESTLLKALVHERNLTGVANVTAKTGKSFDQLLAEFTLALIADDLSGLTPVAGAKYTVPSWNTRDIFAGINRELVINNVRPPVFPLFLHDIPYGNARQDVPGVNGGSAAFFDLHGSANTRVVVDLSSLPQSTLLRLAILRVQ